MKVQWGGGILSKRKNPKDLQRFNKSKKLKTIIVGSIIGIIIIIGGINLYRTFALYKEEQSFNVLNGVVPNFKKCSVELNKEWTFEYIGSEKEFTVPCDGNYRIELWGAQAGSNGGQGGYTSGEIVLKQDKQLYIYVGGEGNAIDGNTQGGYNGGGATTKNSRNFNGASGGGASDIRLENGLWSDFNSLKSRIMVAAGGAWGDIPYGSAGGLNGYDGEVSSWAYYGNVGKGGSQTHGGIAPSTYHDGIGRYATAGTMGLFGQGGTGGSNISYDGNTSGGGSGGGGGYYGGSGSSGFSNGSGYSGGGSSFISGHEGCDAIKEESTATNIQHTGQPNHYSGYIFRNTKMIDGAGYSWTTTKGTKTDMPTHDGLGTMTGNSGNGYAKITYLGKN